MTSLPIKGTSSGFAECLTFAGRLLGHCQRLNTLANLEEVHFIGNEVINSFVMAEAVASPGGCMWVHLHPIHTPAHPPFDLTLSV